VSVAIGPGVIFGGYRVESVVGRGGMGVVYRATDLSLQRPVALKLIAPELAQDERFRARFLAEPRLAASLDHPSVVPIYEAGEREGQLYLAMRWVEGSDLRDILERDGCLAAGEAVRLLLQVAEALDATHRRGLVHRDVKPANILVDEDGHAYLSDFGITKELGGAPTDSGVVGTLNYLAPEQIRGEDVDGRTDCYALACVLYECLAGAPPFRRATEAETLWAHMRAPPPPLRAHPALDRVMRKALGKQRDDRYSTCTEFIQAAGGALGVASSVLGRPRASRAALVVLAGAVLLAAASAVALITSLEGGSQPERGPALDVATNSVAAFDVGANRLALAAPLPGRPTDVAGWRGTAWVSTVDSTSVTGVNARTQSISRTVPLTGTADAVAAGEGAVWVVDARRGVLSRIEPGYERVTQRIRFRPSPRASRPLGRLQAARASLAVAAGAVWLANGEERLLRVDSGTGHVTAIPADRRLDAVTAGGGAVWAISSRSATVVRVDPRAAARRGRPATISIGARSGSGSPYPIAIAATDHAVWVLNGNTTTVTRIDPRTLSVLATIPLAADRVPSDIAASGRTAWVANGDGSLSRIEENARAARSIRIGESLERVAVDGRRVWVTTTAFDQKLPGGAG
jgi:DNA-binding beta-propeller fold protein YncE